MTAAPHSARCEELLPAYALGALDGDDLRELEEHLDAGCEECRRQLAHWQQDLVLRMTAGAATAAGTAPSPRRRSWWLPLAAAALLAVAVWGVAGQTRLRGELERLTAERDRLARQVAVLDHEVTLAREAAERASQALQVVAAPGVKSVVLTGLGPAPQAKGQTYVNPRQGGALFYAFDLPALPQGKTYELWYIAAGKPVPAGTFAVDPQGAASVRVERVPDVASIEAWAVTVEPAGGVPQPTGAMVLKG